MGSSRTTHSSKEVDCQKDFKHTQWRVVHVHNILRNSCAVLVPSCGHTGPRTLGIAAVIKGSRMQESWWLGALHGFRMGRVLRPVQSCQPPGKGQGCTRRSVTNGRWHPQPPRQPWTLGSDSLVSGECTQGPGRWHPTMPRGCSCSNPRWYPGDRTSVFP